MERVRKPPSNDASHTGGAEVIPFPFSDPGEPGSHPWVDSPLPDDFATRVIAGVFERAQVRRRRLRRATLVGAAVLSAAAAIAIHHRMDGGPDPHAKAAPSASTSSGRSLPSGVTGHDTGDPLAETPSRPALINVAPEVFRVSDGSRDLEVEVTVPYAIAATEVTQAQYDRVMHGNPSRFRAGNHGSRPVDSVRFSDAARYCRQLSLNEGLPPCYDIEGDRVTWVSEGLYCRGYRLPTDAEWELAARARGRAGSYPGSVGLSGEEFALWNIAYFASNSDAAYEGAFDCIDPSTQDRGRGRCGTHPVGQRKMSGRGLYDMSGNVREWVWDYKGPAPFGSKQRANLVARASVVDPIGPSHGEERVQRGCGWNDQEADCAFSAERRWSMPDLADPAVGFRIVRSMAEPR